MRIGIVCVLAAAAAFSGEPPGSYYVNEAWGFKVKVPKGWRHAAVASDTPWLCAKHLGKRELEGRLEDREWMTTEAPEMWVVGFPKDAKSQVTNPYGTFRDYITRHSGFLRSASDHRFITEKETRVGDTKVSVFELRKGEKKRIGRHVVAWVFHFDDIDFAVQFKVLEWHYADYKSTFAACLKSFRRVKRTKALGGGTAATSRDAISSRWELHKLAPEERARAFRDAVGAEITRSADGLSDGWRRKDAKRFVVLTDADPKFVKASMAHAQAVLVHFDKLFGKHTAEYVPPFILRIFATEDQRRAYGKDDLTGDLVFEIVIYSGKGWVKDEAFEDLNESLWSLWQQERHSALEGSQPPWIKEGFAKYMRMMRSKGRKITFSHGDYDRDEIRLQIKADKYESLLSLMSAGITDEGGGGNNAMSGYERERQVRTLVLWLMRQGNKGKRKNLVRDFIMNLIGALEDQETAWRKTSRDKEATFSADGHAARKEAWKRSFGDWDEADWKRFTAVWLSFAK